jgi:hypothetical protein
MPLTIFAIVALWLAMACHDVPWRAERSHVLGPLLAMIRGR